MAEQIATRPGTAPRIVELHERPAAVVRIEGPASDLPALFQEAFALAAAAIQGSGAAFAGEPFGRYEAFGERISAEAGFPFAGTVQPTGRVYVTSLPAGRAVTMRHVGPYEQLGEAWGRGQAWIGAEGLTVAGPPWECYLTGPEDPGPTITEIFWPVR